MSKKLSKREFIRYGLLGSGAVLGLTAFRWPAHAFSPPSPAAVKGEVWKWSKEAVYYVSTPRGTKCQLCPNECTVEEDDVGDCRTRVNEDGKLYSIVYGNPCAIHVDPIEKKPLLHFHPESRAYSIATAGCNLACLNCQNWQISQKSPKETRNHDLMPDKLVDEAVKNNCESIAYTYSEPIVFYEYMYDSAKIARDKGIKNVMVTAGYINERPLHNLCKYIDAANVDLKSFSNDTYMRLNAGELEPVLNTLKIMKEEGVWLEITNLVVPEWTDDLDMIEEMCNWLYENGFKNNPLHFSRFTPLHKLTHLPQTPVETLKKARKIALDAGLHHVYIGNVPGSEGENTFCPECGKKIIDRRGYYILNNHIKDGKCGFCGQAIAGVWG
ncbi:MAG: AmmeMemoRadiSam system radical SAM enzyme [Bacteroidota bacterium]